MLNIYNNTAKRRALKGGVYGSLGLLNVSLHNHAASPWLSLDSCGLAVNADKCIGYGDSGKM
jgi:hypothetical protein